MDDQCTRCGSALTKGELESNTKRGDSRSFCNACSDPSATSDLSATSAPHATHSVDARPRMGSIAQFVPKRLLGSGAFGDVWLAQDTTLDRSVALKLASLRHPDASTFLHEAKTSAGLRHPNIVAIYEVGEHEGRVYIASELIQGITLKDFLSSGRPSTETIVNLLIPISNALHFAHDHGVVHRDVKPANILVNEASQPFVTDFGIAKHLRADETISSEGQIVGTARYMSPEQASGKTKETDARSDLYAIGVMMFEMLTGESPFRGNAQAIVSQKVTNDAPSPRTLEPSIPRDLETICLKCLERDPSKRFSDVNEFADELQRFADGEPIRSRPISRAERGWRWCKKRPAISGLLLALFISLTAGLLGVTYFLRESRLSEAKANNSLYRSWMNLAAFHVSNGDTTALRSVLDRIASKPELRRLRGFGWQYHRQLLSRLNPINGMRGPVSGLATTHDGNICAATTGDDEIRVWDASSGKLLRTLNADQDGFTELSFSPTSSHLVAGSVDGYLRFYEPLASDRITRQVEHGPPIRFLTHSPDGRFLASAGNRGAVRLWNPDGQMVSALPTGKPLETRAIRFSPDGRRLFVAREDGRIRQWLIAEVLRHGVEEVPLPETEFETHSNVTGMAVSHDGQSLAVASYDSTLSIKSLRREDANADPRALSTRWGLVQQIEFLDDSNTIAVLVSEGRLYTYDFLSGHETAFVDSHSLPTGKLSLSGDEQTLFIGSGDGSVSSIDSSDMRSPSVLWSESPARTVHFIGGGRTIVATYEDGRVRKWNVQTGELKAIEDDDFPLTSLMAVNHKGDRCVTAGIRAEIEVRDTESMKVLASLPGKASGVSAMQFSNSGKIFAVALRQGPLRVYSTNSWSQPTHELPASDRSIGSIAIDPEDRYIAIARGGPVEIYDTAAAQFISTVQMNDVSASAVRFCLNGNLLAVGTDSGKILLIDTRTWKVRTTIKAHRGRVNAFTELKRDGMLVSAGRDRQLQLWDLTSGDLVTRLMGHFRQVFSLAASQDDKVLVSGGLEGDIRIWRAGD